MDLTEIIFNPDYRDVWGELKKYFSTEDWVNLFGAFGVKIKCGVCLDNPSNEKLQMEDCMCCERPVHQYFCATLRLKKCRNCEETSIKFKCNRNCTPNNGFMPQDKSCDNCQEFFLGFLKEVHKRRERGEDWTSFCISNDE